MAQLQATGVTGSLSVSSTIAASGNITTTSTAAASGNFGSIASSWAGSTTYPTLFSSATDRWVMHINPHISYTQNGINGFAGSMAGATIRLASNPAADTYWDIGTGTNSVGTDKFSIGRAGSNILAITSGGSVGIGTTSPLLTASDRGNLTINGSATSILTFGIAGAYSGYIFSTGTVLELDAQGARNIQFNTNGQERMRLTSGGSLQIGTSSGSGAKTFIYDNRSNSSAIDESALYIRQDGSNPIQTWAGGGANERMRITSGGLVGINTNSPTSRLSVCSTTACSTVVNVQGCAGQLFSVTDNLVGDIFSVSDISGIPILNVNSNGTVCVDSKIAVGANHTVSGAYASVTGGICNTASGACSTVGGGQGNTASGTSSAVAGGGQIFSGCVYGNTASGNWSTVGGGRSNTACGCFSTVSGGYFNFASGFGSSIAGGKNNTASAVYAAVLNGFGNQACYNFSSVGGGVCQTTSGCSEFRVANLSKASGTFRINHPDPSKQYTHYLSHSFVESPTAGDNIYRYKVNVVNGQATITLPSYYKYLNENDQIWVTPQGHFGVGYGEINAQQTQVTIYGNADGEYNVLLIGTRKDTDAVEYWQGTETYK
jgi:hypothetical protein